MNATWYRIAYDVIEPVNVVAESAYYVTLADGTRERTSRVFRTFDDAKAMLVEVTAHNIRYHTQSLQHAEARKARVLALTMPRECAS